MIRVLKCNTCGKVIMPGSIVCKVGNEVYCSAQCYVETKNIQVMVDDDMINEPGMNVGRVKEAVYIGEPMVVTLWRDKYTSRRLTIHKGVQFIIGKWIDSDRDIESVMTKYGEWVCDVDSSTFSQFKVMEEEND